MKFNKKTFGWQTYFILRLLAGFAGLIIISCVFYLGCNLTKTGNKSDKELITRFNENKVEFQKLVEMARVDSHIIRVDPDFIWSTDGKELVKYKPDSTFTEERWNEYRQLFSKLNLTNGMIQYNNPEQVLFFPGGDKGIIYCNCVLTPVFESLDKVNSVMLGSNKIVYRLIENNWYVYYKPD